MSEGKVEAYLVKIPVYVLASSPHEAARLSLELVRTEPMEPVVTVETMDRKVRNFLKVNTATYEITDEYYIQNTQDRYNQTMVKFPRAVCSNTIRRR